MILLTITGIATVILSVKLLKEKSNSVIRSQILGLVLINIIIGVIGQSIGVIQVLQMLKSAGEVPPVLISGGLKSTFIPFIYAVFWALIGTATWLYSKRLS